MTLTGQETVYYLARKNTATNEDSVLRLNSYSGLFSQSDDFDGASKYKTFDEAYAIVDLHNKLANLTGQAYEYYVIEHNVESFRLNESGDRVEEGATEDVPVEGEPTE